MESCHLLHLNWQTPKIIVMRKLIIFILTLTSFSQLSAMHQVQGTVVDQFSGGPIAGVTVRVMGTFVTTSTDKNGCYQIDATSPNAWLSFSIAGYETQEIRLRGRKTINIQLSLVIEEVEMEMAEPVSEDISFSDRRSKAAGAVSHNVMSSPYPAGGFSADQGIVHNTEGYSTIHENGFKKPSDDPLSTFSIDVDAASYSNMRRFLNYGQQPPKDAVRIEEMVNYFKYDYEQPNGKHPFAINTELAAAPWNEDHVLVQIGLQGKVIPTEDLPPSNLVFLIDVSGSMSDANKLPLLKSSFKLLVQKMRPQDRVAIVVYAGAAGMVLPSTAGTEKEQIITALDRLNAGGSTAGGAGIELAYKTAQQYFVNGGNNRVILATDGDFNVGSSSNADMERLIEKKREDGVFLTVLGFGMGNYKDDKMEILADKGNGNYAYIDNIREARKVFINEFGGTLFTIAKDVKIQVEFNPTKVQAYRLIGYENRLLEAEDFNDDKKDAGELGSGHTVTALYEVIPVGVESEFIKDVDPLKYQTTTTSGMSQSKEWLTVKFRYKDPEASKSQLIVETLSGKPTRTMSENLQWASAVAGFGMLLRDSEYKGALNYDKVLEMAKSAKGADEFGYRNEFIQLVSTARSLFPPVGATSSR